MKNSESYSDEELVKVVRSKDQEQYAHLVMRYQDKLLRYANYLTRDSEMSQDIVQQSFIKTFQNLQGFNTNKKFSSWIYRITHNEAMNHLKKNNRIQQLEPDHWENIPDDTDIEDQISKKQLDRLVQDSLDQLPVKYRSIITLYFIDGKSYEEISDILRLPIAQ